MPPPRVIPQRHLTTLRFLVRKRYSKNMTKMGLAMMMLCTLPIGLCCKAVKMKVSLIAPIEARKKIKIPAFIDQCIFLEMGTKNLKIKVGTFKHLRINAIIN